MKYSKKNGSKTQTFILFLLFTTTQIIAQQKTSIKGTITDKNKNPIPASIYLSHTSVGTTTNKTGAFELKNLPDGKYELIISAIGYETKIFPIESNNYPIEINITLHRKANELEEVIVEPKESNGWRKYGKYFTDNFIGTTKNAKRCKILNKEILRFRYSDKTNKLTVKANEPIIIINENLGYKIVFQLIEFTADFNKNTVAWYGHPFFTDLNKNNKSIAQNRSNTYNGSLMHFIRAAYSDNLKEENFKVKATVTRANTEKDRVTKAFKGADSAHHRNQYEITEVSRGTVHVTTTDDTINISKDSLDYYKRVMKQPDTLTQNTSLESLNELITKTGNYSKFLFFRNTMEVTYSRNKSSRSVIELQTPQPLQILKNGSFFPPTELITFNHWSEYEKICNMLPLDFARPN